MREPIRITPAATTAELVPIVEIPNPERSRWQRNGEHGEAPDEWTTLSIDRTAVNGAALLRFMRESKANPMAATYDLLESAFGVDQMRMLEAAELSTTDLLGVAAAVVAEFSEA